MPYDRWGQTAATAAAYTSTTLTDADLETAEEAIFDELGWRPDPDSYGSADPDAYTGADVRVVALGRAIAWQAAHRTVNTPAASDGDAGIASEKVDNYSVTYRDGQTPAESRRIPARTLTLLARGGWYAPALSGRTHTSAR